MSSMMHYHYPDFDHDDEPLPGRILMTDDRYERLNEMMSGLKQKRDHNFDNLKNGTQVIFRYKFEQPIICQVIFTDEPYAYSLVMPDGKFLKLDRKTLKTESGIKFSEIYGTVGQTAVFYVDQPNQNFIFTDEKEMDLFPFRCVFDTAKSYGKSKLAYIEILEAMTEKYPEDFC